MAISSIEEVLQDVREGKMIIIVDDEDREDEGDVMIASEKVTPEAMRKLGFAQLDDCLAAVGYGKLTPHGFVTAVLPPEQLLQVRHVDLCKWIDGIIIFTQSNSVQKNKQQFHR